MAHSKTPTNAEGGRRNGLTYADAGVDIAAADAFVKAIAGAARSTARPGADATLGGFGAVFDPRAAGYTDPLIVATTDGVGTKLKIAIETGRHDTIGVDLVAMCVNDLIVQGAEPLFFLDYYATAALDRAVAVAVVEGIARACRDAGCALIGGETAEMPGLYGKGDYDLAGFAVGAVERTKLLPRTNEMAAGDALIGLASSGVHSNGYSLVRRIVADGGHDFTAPAPFAAGRSLGEALLEPTRLYVRPLLPHLKAGRVKGIAHITGGGLTENVPRVLPKHLSARFDLARSPLPPVFRWLMNEGGIAPDEMLRTFNCGIGMVLIVSAGEAESLATDLAAAGERAFVCGALEADSAGARVHYSGALA